ncbi:oligosaccharide flippase family protein [Mesorhizobium sp. WSM2239]|uniref:Oligosaccharide flippase family protein n=2 Tax=unclassified Mesorhizobium TaxID=325217 RepID=A0AAU8DIV9_9HYPH
MHKGESASRSGLVAKASIWVVAGKLTARAIDLCSLLILAHLLSPSEFGLIALAMATILIVEVVVELPLAQAMVRIPDLTEPILATAFTLGLLRGILLALLLGLLALPLSLFYQEPRLLVLVWALTSAPILRGLVSPWMVVFVRRFDFRREFALDVIGKSSALIVATAIALKTGSYWAIAGGIITTPFVAVVMSYVFAPMRPRLTLSQWPVFSDMVSWNTASQLVSAVNWQMDKLLLGRLIDLPSFGRYSVADNLAGIPQQALVQPLTRPLMAGFATINSPAEYAPAYCKAMNALVATTAPILVCVAMLSDPLVRLVLGERWIGAAVMLQWLASSYLLSVPTEALPPLAMAINRTRFVAVRMIAELVVKLPALIIGLALFGLTGALAARCIATAAVLISVGFIARSLIGVSLKQQGLALWRPAVSCAAMAVFLHFVAPFVISQQSTWFLMLATAAAGLAAVGVYGVALLVLWIASNRPAGIEAVVMHNASRLFTFMRSRTA